MPRVRSVHANARGDDTLRMICTSVPSWMRYSAQAPGKSLTLATST